MDRLESRLLLAASPLPIPSAGGDTGAGAVELFNASAAVFVENRGQWADESIHYAFNGRGINVGFTDAGPTVELYKADDASPAPDDGAPSAPAAPTELQSTRFSMRFDGARPAAPVGVDRAAATFNYLVGDRARWRTDVAGYAAVEYRSLYDGINLKTWGKRNGLKYEFHVAPGADWQDIRVRYEGIKGLSLDTNGALHIQTSLGAVTEAAPVIYQVIDGQRMEVAGQFVLFDADTRTASP